MNTSTTNYSNKQSTSSSSSTPAPLLLSSNFCRSRRPKKLHVHVCILRKVPTTPKRTRKRDTNTKCSGRFVDHDSNVYASQELMVALSLQQGDVAWLSSNDDDNDDNSSSSNICVPVTVSMLHCENQDCPEKNDNSSNDGNDNDSTIQVSPTMAASVGCFDDYGRKVWLSTQQQQQHQKWQHADIIEIKQIGRPVPKFHFLQLAAQQQQQQIYSNPLNLLSRQSNKKLLISYSSLISVLDDGPGYNGELYFFEVISINQTKRSTFNNNYHDRNQPRPQRQAYKTSHATHWKLLKELSSPGDSFIERKLPCLSRTRCFYQSTINPPERKSRVLQDGEEDVAVPVQLCRHPSVNDVVKALSLQTHIEVSQKTIHVIGTEENHVDTCIETAADQLGMRYLAVHGLAAYAHASDEDVSTGSLIDQLAGLKAAMKDATSSAPCILHLVDFHLELNHSDEELRHQQEQRFWTTIVEELEVIPVSSTLMSSAATVAALSSMCYTHKMLVVISTEHSLSAGPFLENLVHSPVTIHVPDEAYAKQLWPDLKQEVLVDLILGRSAQEIIHIKHLWECKCKEVMQGSNGTVTLTVDATSALIPSICHEVDEKKTKITANIPDVHWEDVGGLEHVRQEIMDAIELPLKHRNLFPHSGRSGILLYGPPGTGKTLIAKAVATECHLPFLSVKGPELLGSYVGESEANIRATFTSAREAATEVGGSSVGGGGAAILFFDELDSLAPRRGGVGDGGGVMERVVATLCAEFDGKKMQTLDDVTADNDTADNDTAEPIVFVIGATNRPDLLDPSLLRPGRLDRLVYLGQANKKENRAQILAALMRNFKFEHGMDAMTIALQVVDQLPQSMTGADFSAIASGALQRSLHRLCDEVELEVDRRRLLEETRKQSSPPRDGMSNIDVDFVVNEWDDDRLLPTVTTKDLLKAGEEVIPSVSAEELAGYEALRVQFSPDFQILNKQIRKT